MSALDLSRKRLEATQRALDEASEALMSGNVEAATKRCARVYADLRDVHIPFRYDWRALDLLLGQLAVIRAWSERHGVEPPEHLATVTEHALEVRLAWFDGEEAA